MENIVIKTDLDLTEYNKKVSDINKDFEKINRKFGKIDVNVTKGSVWDSFLKGSETVINTVKTVSNTINTVTSTADSAVNAVGKIRQGFELLKFVTSGNTDAIKSYFNALTDKGDSPFIQIRKDIASVYNETDRVRSLFDKVFSEERKEAAATVMSSAVEDIPKIISEIRKVEVAFNGVNHTLYATIPALGKIETTVKNMGGEFVSATRIDTTPINNLLTVAENVRVNNKALAEESFFRLEIDKKILKNAVEYGAVLGDIASPMQKNMSTAIAWESSMRDMLKSVEKMSDATLSFDLPSAGVDTATGSELSGMFKAMNTVEELNSEINNKFSKTISTLSRETESSVFNAVTAGNDILKSGFNVIDGSVNNTISSIGKLGTAISGGIGVLANKFDDTNNSIKDFDDVVTKVLSNIDIEITNSNELVEKFGNGIKKSLNTANSSLTGLSDSVKSTVPTIDKISSSVDTTSLSIDSLRNALKLLTSASGNLKVDLGGISAATNEVNDQTLQAIMLAKTYGNILNSQSKSIDTVTTATNALSSSESSIIDRLDKFISIASDVQSHTGKLASVIGVAEEKVEKFETSFRSLIPTLNTGMESVDNFGNSLIDTAIDKAMESASESVKEFAMNTDGFIGLAPLFIEAAGGMSSSALAIGTALSELAPVVGGLMALEAALGEVTNKLIEISSVISNIRNAVGKYTGETGESLDILSAKVSFLSNTYSAESEEIIKTANSVSKATGESFETVLNSMDRLLSRTAGNVDNSLDMLNEYSIQLTEAGMGLEEQISTVLFQSQSGVFNDKLLDLIKESGIKLREYSDATKTAITEAFGVAYSTDLEARIRGGATTTLQAATEISEKMLKMRDKIKAQSLVADVFGSPGEDVGSERSARLLSDLNQVNTVLPRAFAQLEAKAGVTATRIGKVLGKGIADKSLESLQGADLMQAIIEDSQDAGKSIEWIKDKFVKLGISIDGIDFDNITKNLRLFTSTSEINKLENDLKKITEANEQRKSSIAQSMSKVSLQRKLMEQQEEELWLKIYSFVAPLIEKLNDSVFGFYQGIEKLQNKLGDGIESFAKKYTASLIMIIGAITVFNYQLLISAGRFVAFTVAQRAASIATAAWTLVVNGATTAVRLFNLAIATNPYGAAASAALLLAAALIGVNKALKDTYDSQEAYNNLQDKVIESYADQKGKLDELFSTLKKVDATESERKAAVEEIKQKYGEQVGVLNLQTATLKDIESLQSSITSEIYKGIVAEQQRLRVQELNAEKVRILAETTRRLSTVKIDISPAKIGAGASERIQAFGFKPDDILSGKEAVSVYNQLNNQLDINKIKLAEAKSSSDINTVDGKRKVNAIQSEVTRITATMELMEMQTVGLSDMWSHFWGSGYTYERMNLVKSELEDMPGLIDKMKKEFDAKNDTQTKPKAKPITPVASEDEIKKAFDAASKLLDDQKQKEINNANEAVKNRTITEEAGQRAVLYITEKYSKLKEKLNKQYNTDVVSATAERISAQLALEEYYHTQRLKVIDANEKREIEAREHDLRVRTVSAEKAEIDLINIRLRYAKKRESELGSSGKDTTSVQEDIRKLQAELEASLIKMSDDVRTARKENAKASADLAKEELEIEIKKLEKKAELARLAFESNRKYNKNDYTEAVNLINKLEDDINKASKKRVEKAKSDSFERVNILKDENALLLADVNKYEVDAIALEANGQKEAAEQLRKSGANKREMIDINNGKIIVAEENLSESLREIEKDRNAKLKEAYQLRMQVIKDFTDSIDDTAKNIMSLMDSFNAKFGKNEASAFFSGFASAALKATDAFNGMIKDGTLAIQKMENGRQKIVMGVDENGKRVVGATAKVALAIADVVGNAITGILGEMQEVSASKVKAIDEMIGKSEETISSLIEKFNAGGKAAEETSLAQIEAEKERMQVLKDERRKEIQSQKAMASVELAIKAALAIANAFNAPFPLNIIMPAVVAAGFFASVALMQSRASNAIAESGGKMTDRGFYSAGSKKIQGKSHRMGGELVEMESGEYVFSQKHSAKFGELFDMIHSNKISDMKDLSGVFMQPYVIKQVNNSKSLTSYNSDRELSRSVEKLISKFDKLVYVIEKQNTTVSLDASSLTLSGRIALKDEQRLKRNGSIK